MADLEHPALDIARKVPAWLESHIVPRDLAIQSLLDIPNTRLANIVNDTLPNNFIPLFSNATPVIDEKELLRRSTPPLARLYKLSDLLVTAVPQGSQSFLDWRYNNTPTPLFMITYWTAQAEALLEQRRWKKVHAYLQNLTRTQSGHLSANIAVAQAAERALMTLADIGWDDALDCLDVNTGVSARHLCSLVNQEMLGGHIMDGMVRRIQYRKDENSLYHTDIDLDRIRVEELAVLAQLRKSGRLLRDPVGYMVNRECLALRALGDSIGRGEIDQVYLPAHVNGNHWTVFLIDIAANQLYYGDSFGGSPHSTDIALIQLWIRHHQPEGGSLQFVRSIPIGSQPAEDGISCGIIVVNAIAHALFGDHLWTSDTRDLLRIEQYLEIALDHLALRTQQVRVIITTNSSLSHKKRGHSQ